MDTDYLLQTQHSSETNVVQDSASSSDSSSSNTDLYGKYAIDEDAYFSQYSMMIMTKKSRVRMSHGITDLNKIRF